MDLMVLAMARKYMDKKVAELMSAGWTKEVVKELPTTGNEKTIYMVEQIDGAGNIYYDEYMYTNGKFDGIGTTKVDLSNYAKIEYVDNAKAENWPWYDLPEGRPYHRKYKIPCSLWKDPASPPA